MPSRAAVMAPATSPSDRRWTRAPVFRTRSTTSSCRGRSRIITVTSLIASRLARATILMFVSIGAVMSIDRAGLAAGGDLFHVHAGARVEHRAALGDGDDRKRVGLAPRDQPGSVDRVDGDVDDRRVARAEPLAVIEHRRLVFLPLADHDDAIHVHHVEQEPHGVDGRLIGGVLVAPAHPARGRQGGGLGGADQIERQVRIERSESASAASSVDRADEDDRRIGARLV